MNVSIESLSHSFFNGTETQALSEITVNAQPGHFIAIIGPSGCGKSTLLRLMANLIEPTQGEILIDGISPKKAVEQGKIAWMSQSPALLPWLSVEKNLELALDFSKRYKPTTLGVSETLQMVGLTSAAQQYPFTLSGGMQQRLSLARVLIQQAQIWLMDEPFAALDELTREKLTSDLWEIWKALKPSVFWVTHNIYEAIKMADRILVFSAQPGKIVGDFDINLTFPRQEENSQFQFYLSSIRKVLQTNQRMS
ncbi:MAG: ABC transporter ATP-binding protein [Anaerolineaceae bacterium]